MEGEIAWIVEASRDGVRWRFFGKAWAGPAEPLLVHALPQFVRFRRSEEDTFGPPLERTGHQPMALLRLEEAAREELWPDERHVGLPVLLPGGEEGRLLRFRRTRDEERWTWALEFRGLRHPG